MDAYVYARLSGDQQLRQLLGASEADSRIDPRATHKKTRVIVYKVVPVSFDGHTHTDRIEIRIIERDDDRLRAMQDRVLALLVMREGEAPRALSRDGLGAMAVYACAQNGGGELEDEYDVHRLLYFNVKWRSLHE
jgi:hypothetical protein